MRNRWRLLFLVGLTAMLAGTGRSSAESGLLCGTPDDPIPCSSFNDALCIYSYNPDTNCCVASTSNRRCVQVCC